MDSSSFGKTLQDLADAELDVRKKKKLRQLASQLEAIFNRQANNVQVALGGAELSWQVRLDDVLNEIRSVQEVGQDTRTILKGVDASLQGLADIVRDQGASVVQLRMDFQEVAERVSELVTDVASLKRQSTESRRDRVQLARSDEEIRGKINELLVQIEEMRGQLTFALSDLARRTTPEESKELIDRFLTLEKKVIEGTLTSRFEEPSIEVGNDTTT